MSVHRPVARGLRPQVVVAALLGSVAMVGVQAQTTDGQEAATLPDQRIIGNPSDPAGSFGSAYFLSAEELEKFEHTNVHSVLRNVPGVYVRDEDGHAVFPRISIRGSAGGRSNRIAILEDGVPAAMAPYANPSAYYFPTVDRMHAVEVLKGPETMFYGPQTTGGALNLISTPVPQANGGALNVEFGQYLNKKIHANYGVNVGQWGFLVETYQRENDGFQDIDRSQLGSGVSTEEYLGKVRWQSAAGARFRQQFDLKYLYADQISDVSYVGLTDADFRANPNRRYGLTELEQMNHGRRSGVARYQIELAPRSSLTATGYYTETYRIYDRVNQIDGIGLNAGANGVIGRINNGASDAAHFQGVLDGSEDAIVRYGSNHQSFINRGLQLEFSQGFTTGDVDHELLIGVRQHEEVTRNAVNGVGNVTYDQINGSLVLNNRASAVRVRGDAEATSVWIANRITFGDLSLLPILRYEDYEIKANLPKNPTPAQLAARAVNSLSSTTLGLGANYRLNNEWTLIAGIHEGFAPPGTAAGTKGDESINYEAGLRFRRNSFGADAVLFFSEFTSSVRDCLVANPCTGGVVTGTEDAGAKDVYGLELGLFGELYNANGYRVPVRLSFTFTDGEYTENNPGGVQKGDVLDYTPKTIGALQVGVERGDQWRAYLTLNQTGSTCINNTCDRAGVDDRFLTTDSLFTVDVSATYTLSPTLEVYAKVDNVFDERKITHRGADGARGNPAIYSGLGLRLKF